MKELLGNVAKGLEEIARMLPSYADGEGLVIENLNFIVGTLEVNDLSGELNLGLTQILKPSTGGDGGHSGAESDNEGTQGSSPSALPIRIIWPRPPKNLPPAYKEEV